MFLLQILVLVLGTVSSLFDQTIDLKSKFENKIGLQNLCLHLHLHWLDNILNPKCCHYLWYFSPSLNTTENVHIS